MHYSNVQKANCILWLSEYKDINIVQKKYLQEYSTIDPSMKNPNLKIPSESEIRYWYEIFKRKGSWENGETDLIEAKLAKEVRKDPSSVDLHTTIYEKETGILNFFGFKKFHKCHPYKMHLKHQLDKLDLIVRKNFAKDRLEKIHASHQILHRIWFGGEATFYTNGRVECHNHVYLSEDPQNFDSKTPPPNSVPCVTVWASLNFDGLLGPYITNEHAGKNTYSLFLRKFTYELRQIQRLKMKLENLIFIHDDSPLHEGSETFLDGEFPHHWIGPGSKLAEWPRLSPDLNPLCFFLWGHIKHKVYETLMPSNDMTELLHRIHQAFTEITPEMLKESIKAYKERLKMVVENHGNLVDVHHDDENKPEPLEEEAIAIKDFNFH